jgi:hypothetical protein
LHEADARALDSSFLYYDHCMRVAHLRRIMRMRKMLMFETRRTGIMKFRAVSLG